MPTRTKYGKDKDVKIGETVAAGGIWRVWAQYFNTIFDKFLATTSFIFGRKRILRVVYVLHIPIPDVNISNNDGEAERKYE